VNRGVFEISSFIKIFFVIAVFWVLLAVGEQEPQYGNMEKY